MKGVRQVFHPEPNGTCASEQTIAKAKLAGDVDLVFELCVRADDLSSAVALAAAVPSTRFALDHCGGHHQLNSNSPEEMRTTWRAGITKLGRMPNVYCKLSGLIGAQGGTETCTGVGDWTPDAQRETILHCLRSFPPERLMFGGDWPVCTLSAPIGAWIEGCARLIREAQFTAEQQAWVWEKSAVKCYRLDC